MSLKYTKTPDGYFVEQNGTLGSFQATLHRIEKPKDGPRWRICFATCSGAARPLQGQIYNAYSYLAARERFKHLDTGFMGDR